VVFCSLILLRFQDQTGPMGRFSVFINNNGDQTKPDRTSPSLATFPSPLPDGNIAIQ
jgi:hypothetical protein